MATTLTLHRHAAVALVLLLDTSLTLADYPDEGTNPDLDTLKAQIEEGEVQQAERELRTALEADESNANLLNLLNLLGYANRKLQNYPDARGFYERALAIDPTHIGALEYMGELELETGNTPAARALLNCLQAACPMGCEELEDLENAFAEKGLESAPAQ